MDPKSLVLVYHPKCKASTDLLVKTKQLKDISVEYINIAEDTIETDIVIDTVPLIILDNSPDAIHIGKEAYDKIEKLINKMNTPVYGKSISGGLKYGSVVSFVEDENAKSKKADSIDISIKANV
jgi:hypothetical protein